MAAGTRNGRRCVASSPSAVAADGEGADLGERRMAPARRGRKVDFGQTEIGSEEMGIIRDI